MTTLIAIKDLILKDMMKEDLILQDIMKEYCSLGDNIFADYVDDDEPPHKAKYHNFSAPSNVPKEQEGRSTRSKIGEAGSEKQESS